MERGCRGHAGGFCHPFAVSVSRELPSEAQQVQTQLHQSCSQDFYTYRDVPWKMYIRKEVRGLGGAQPAPGGGQGDVERAAASAPCPLRAGTGLVWGGRVDGGGFCAAVPSWQVFYPKESCNDPLLLDLIFRQVRC